MKITLCADDFGLNDNVSKAILQLAIKGRLSAISCMVNLAGFTEQAPNLLTLNEGIQLGLHFNLTQGQFLSNATKSCFGLNELLIKSHLRVLNLKHIALEFNKQLDCFIDLVGRLPDFIDGHQHVHQFPGIRTVILDSYEKRLRSHGTFVRSTYPALSLKPYQLKSKVLATVGGKALHAQLSTLQIPCNRFFAGVYDFSKDSDYRSLFRQWLAKASENTLIMCHPGDGEQEEDGIAFARVQEFRYFSSEAFVNDCDEYGVVL